MNIRYALRLARRSPATTALIVVVLALGIGASTACDAPVRDPAPAPIPPTDTSAPAPDEAAITTATIIYMEATPAEIDERRTAYVVEQDYYVMTDDLIVVSGGGSRLSRNAGIRGLRVARKGAARSESMDRCVATSSRMFSCSISSSHTGLERNLASLHRPRCTKSRIFRTP